MSARVAIIHPWFPQYRRGFFDELCKQALEHDIQVDIFHGDPPPEWNERGDSVSVEYAQKLPTRFIKTGKRNFVLKDPRPLWQQGPYDAIVLEQAVRNLESYALLLNRQGAKLAFWGHGKTYTSQIGKVQERLKQILTHRGDWFFAYTAGGAEAVKATGYSAAKITVVRNSIDTVALRRSLAAITAENLSEFSLRHDLKGKTGLFIGGLDASKRLDFLLESADMTHRADPDFRLIVAGSGASQDLVLHAAASRPWLVHLGPLFGAQKATALAAAEVLLMPGRVGLVAVDSFAAGRPIITTDWPFHAPEFEYLTAGKNSIVTSDNVAAFSDATRRILNDSAALKVLQLGARASADAYTVAAMAENFVGGLRSLLNDEGTGP